MGRALRVDVGGLVYHVLNRASARATLVDGPADDQPFEQVLAEAQACTGLRILAYGVMPNHWHLVLWPAADGALRRFMTSLTPTHTQRWHAAHGSAGSGHLYQGRYKSFLVQADEHLLAGLPLRRAQPLARAPGAPRRALAWGSPWRRAWPGAGSARGRAGAAPRELAGVRQPRRAAGRARAVAHRHPARPAVRRRALARADGPALRPRLDPAPARPPEAEE